MLVVSAHQSGLSTMLTSGTQRGTCRAGSERVKHKPPRRLPLLPRSHLLEVSGSVQMKMKKLPLPRRRQAGEDINLSRRLYKAEVYLDSMHI